MRLLVVTQYFWPEPFRINDLVEDLVARGHEVTVLTGLPNYPEGQPYPDYVNAPGKFVEYAGASIVRVPILTRGKGNIRLGLNYLSFVLSGLLLGTWRLRGRAFDAIFVFQTSPITVALPALWLRWLKDAPVLMWVLDLWPESLSAVGAVRSSWLLSWAGRLVSFIYHRCDRILVQSKAFIPNIAKYSGDTSRVRYFPGWAEPIFQESLEQVPLAPELAPFKDTFNVMFAGNIGEAQDFPAILDAAEALKERSDIRWIILGDGRAAEWVRNETRRRGLDDCVHLLGRFPLERMPSFFRGAHALLVSLKKDPIFALTIPGKVQSYLAAGLPILGMLDGEGARVIVESQAGFACAAGDSKGLVDNVLTLVKIKPTNQDLEQAGRIYSNQYFNRENLISDLNGWISEFYIS